MRTTMPSACLVLALAPWCRAEVSGQPVSEVRYRGSCTVLDTFPREISRSQGDVGSCHDFAAIGLLESALHRQYGSRIELSEADLFVRRTVNSKEFFGPLLEKAVAGTPISPDEIQTGEGGWVDQDLRFALRHGIARRKTAGYEQMTLECPAKPAPYLQWRRQLADSLAALGAAVRAKGREQWLVECRKSAGGDGSSFEDLGCLTHAMLKDYYGASFESLLEKKGGAEATEDREKRFLGRGSAKLMRIIRKEREAIRIRFQAGFQLASFKEGVEKRDWILHNLDRRRPVAFSMDIGPDIGWKASGGHGFIVHGYRREADRSYTFLTRNSWGPGNDVPVREADLGRVFAMIVVAAPKDRPGHCQDPSRGQGSAVSKFPRFG